MRIQYGALAIVLAALGQTPACAQNVNYPFQNPDLDIESRITNLISLMTLEEKLDALSTIPDVPRLAVKGSDHVEGLHGLALGGPANWGGWNREQIETTTFPQVVGLGSTWDAPLIQKVAAVEGYEARYIFNSMGRGGIVMRAPNADLARDVRWGRIEESYGEDAFLTGTMAASFVRGLQGNDPKYLLTASLMKHFLANSNENGRGGSSSNFSERQLHEYYAFPFQKGIEEAKAPSYMTAYNAVNGIPMTAHPLIRELTMKAWGLDGIVCTDAGAMSNMVKDHHYAKDLPEAAALAIKAGINQFLEDREVFKPALKEALSRGLIAEADIDQNLRGVYRVMIRLGLLDPDKRVPYSAIRGKEAIWKRQEHRDLALKATLESIVLLKNRDKFLPIDKSKIKRVTVVGPWANDVLLDWYSGSPGYIVSPLAGIKNALGKVRVDWYAGFGTEETEALQAAAHSDLVIVVTGNHPTGDAGWARVARKSYGKEAVDRESIELEDEPFIQKLYAVNPKLVFVLTTSFPYAINWSEKNLPAILQMTHNSQEMGTALAQVIFGDYNPAGRLVHTWPKSWADLPPMMDYNLENERTYMYSTKPPLYPFGYGLSYSSFQYGPITVSAATLSPEGSIEVHVDITNTGSRDGDEVVELYVSHIGSKVKRPIRELKGFTRITIPAGQTRTASIPLRAEDVAYWNEGAHSFSVEQDRLLIQVGASSVDIRQKIEVTIGK